LQAILKVPIVEKICLDAPIVQFVRCFHQCEEIGSQPCEYAF
jgi:hypothetical protein